MPLAASWSLPEGLASAPPTASGSLTFLLHLVKGSRGQLRLPRPTPHLKVHNRLGTCVPAVSPSTATPGVGSQGRSMGLLRGTRGPGSWGTVLGGRGGGPGRGGPAS